MTLHPWHGSDLETIPWDVVVIGAGPGGSITAREAARQGLRTLLLEGRAFPRQKVCGGCLNPRALGVLSAVGLQSLVDELHGEPIRGIVLRSGGLSADVILPAGLSVTRHRLDAALLQAASAAGVTVVTETTATVEPDLRDGLRRITLHHQGQTRAVRSRVVVCADGLLRSSLRSLPEMQPGPAPGARMGVGIVLSRDQWSAVVADRIPRERITMIVGRGGYVGLAWAEDQQLSVAAAVDPQLVKATGSPSKAVHQILSAYGIDFPVIDSGWSGTPPLTTAPRWNAAERLFVIGDAAGYVEPFTGEGMAAALEQSVAVLPLVVQAADEWRSELAAAWQTQHRTHFQRRLGACRMASAILRRPWVSSITLQLIRTFPTVAGYMVQAINRTSSSPPTA